MKNKLEYLNNEKKLYDYISHNLNENNELVATDGDLAVLLIVSPMTIFRWRHKLMAKKLITCRYEFINNKKQCIIKLRG